MGKENSNVVPIKSQSWQFHAAELCFRAGVEMEEMENLGEAKKQYKKALGYNKKFVPVLLRLGFIAYKASSVKVAKKHFQRATKADPNCALAHYNLGNSLDSLDGIGNVNKVLKHYLRAIQICPTDPDFHYNLGKVYEAQKKYSRAIRHLRLHLKHEGYPQDRPARDTSTDIKRMAYKLLKDPSRVGIGIIYRNPVPPLFYHETPSRPVLIVDNEVA